jgi:hypothetical protein
MRSLQVISADQILIRTRVLKSRKERQKWSE